MIEPITPKIPTLIAKFSIFSELYELRETLEAVVSEEGDLSQASLVASSLFIVCKSAPQKQHFALLSSLDLLHFGHIIIISHNLSKNFVIIYQNITTSHKIFQEFC